MTKFNQYTYVTTSCGPALTHSNAADAVDWMADYAIKHPNTCFTGKLWIYDKDGNLVGDIHMAGRYAKIIIGNNNSRVVSICHAIYKAVCAHFSHAA